MTTETKRAVLVTGGAGGLGREICSTLARSGWSVAICDINIEAAEKLAQELHKQGLPSIAISMDLSDAKSMQDGVIRVVGHFGRLDALINNAGIDLTVPVEGMPVESWDQILSVNLRAPFILSRTVLPLMKNQRRGHIVNIASTASLRAWPNASAYHASKWGLLGFSRALHTEARPHGISVSALIAGGMCTPFLTERFPNIDRSTLQDPANVAEAVRFLLECPAGSVIPEMMVLPFSETSWP